MIAKRDRFARPLGVPRHLHLVVSDPTTLDADLPVDPWKARILVGVYITGTVALGIAVGVALTWLERVLS